MNWIDCLFQLANSAGFPLVGILDVDLAHSEFQKHYQRYQNWIDANYMGEMAYLSRGLERRGNLKILFPDVKSVFSVAIPYNRAPAGFEDEKLGPRFARYVQGKDYHVEIFQKLENIMKKIAEEFPEIKWKICVDTSAVLERTWAALSGLGWIGKNSMLIHPQHGSYLFLAEILLNQETGKGPKLLPSYCGSCTRCLSACPTGAFDSQLGLDARKCISYWTLEKRGELSLLEDQKIKMGTWVAGCDRCQEVCPFNFKSVRNDTSQNEIQITWDELINESKDQYEKRTTNSALNRIRYDDFKRNLAIAYENATRKKKSAPHLENNISECADV